MRGFRFPQPNIRRLPSLTSRAAPLNLTIGPIPVSSIRFHFALQSHLRCHAMAPQSPKSTKRFDSNSHDITLKWLPYPPMPRPNNSSGSLVVACSNEWCGSSAAFGAVSGARLSAFVADARLEPFSIATPLRPPVQMLRQLVFAAAVATTGTHSRTFRRDLLWVSPHLSQEDLTGSALSV